MKGTFDLAPWQAAAIYNPFDHFAFYGGVATGKSYSGSQFAIRMMEEHPDKTGFIGANTYDQLSQATLRELFYWLDHYGYEFVVDRQPPPHWGARKQFKSYKNILTVLIGTTAVHAFTRVLSDPDALRGIEFSWYWLDETRDTPENTHDVLLSRMRETNLAKGVITTTTNGEDWSYKRFVLGNDGSPLYGSMHVSTKKSLDYGIITQSYFDAMLRSYSPMMALQELEAQHVNVAGGRAYYSAGQWNQKVRAPWGDTRPSPDRPLIVGCDFNFQPAPCVWMVGQLGPEIYGPRGEAWWECIHWFGEIAHVEYSARQMALSLLSRYPNFFYRIFGDASGNRGTTSNAGETDYNQISEELANGGAMFTIDVDQANPLVKNRVENLNGLLKNAVGEVRMTYSPNSCPLFDGDMRQVGWKPTTLRGQGRLDSGGDDQRTHASDGAGYAAWKLLPPGRRAAFTEGVKSSNLKDIRDLLGM